MIYIKELFAVLAPAEILFLAFVIIYGLMFGINNTLNRVVAFFTGNGVLQSDLGKLLDGAFWFSLFVLFALNLK